MAAAAEGATPRQRVYSVRASSWGSLFDCAHRWEGQALMGMSMPSGLRAHLGTSVHAGTAAYDAAAMHGTPISVAQAIDVFSTTLRKPDREVDYSKDSLTEREAEVIGIKLMQLYCRDVAPLFKFVGVEVTLKPLLIDCGGGIVIRLTGSMDRARVAAMDRGIVIPDLKSGAGVIEDGKAVIKGRAPQVGTYQLMYEHTTGQPTVGGQVLALSTSGQPAVAVSRVWDAKRSMVGTDDMPGLLEHAAAMFRSGLFPPNPQSQLCGERYCARWASCPYHD